MPVKISALPNQTTPDGADPLPVTDTSAGSTKKITMTVFKEWLQSLTQWVTTAMLANTSVTADKIDFTTFQQVLSSTARTLTSATPQTLATITVPSPGTYRVRSNMIFNDSGSAGQADVVFALSVNGSYVGGGDFVTSQAASYNASHEFEREFTWTTGAILLQSYRNTGSKSISVTGSRQVFIERVG